MFMFQTQKNNPRTRLIICLALIGSVFLYIALAYFMSSSRTIPSDGYKQIQVPITLISGIMLLICAWRSLTTLGHSQSAAKFQVNMVIVLAIAEAITIMGLLLFFSGMSFGAFLPFALVTIAAQSILILPRVLAFR
jgi:F0F1-type ATP synthase membrane subunit c/vacuolar-type H+-ATPase subunit K